MRKMTSRTAGAACALLAAAAIPSIAGAANLQDVSVMLLSATSARITFQFDDKTPSAVNVSKRRDGLEVSFVGVTLAGRKSFRGLLPVRSIDCEGIATRTRCLIAGAALVEITERAEPGFLTIDVAGAQSEPARPVAETYAPADAGPSVRRSTAQLKTRMYALMYADSNEIANLLVVGAALGPNDTFSPTQSFLGQTNQGGFSAPAQGAAPPPAPDSVRINDEVAVDRRRNVLVITADEARQRVIADIIAAIDKPMPSVMLEAEIVELDENAARDAGLDASVNGSLAQGTFSAKDHQGPTASVNFAANLYAAIAHGHGRVLARPRVLATSGLNASILTGSALPITTSIAFAGSGGLVQQQVQYINVGVNLQILPRVNGDGSVSVRLYSAVSSVTGYVQGIPEVSQREATTVAMTRDGEPLVIGGLVQRQDLEQMSRIPGISSLPIIGGLFKVHHDSMLSTVIYIVVTPRIIPSPGS